MADDEYDEEEYLQLSGIQHFLYCRRQWALIHIEQQWCENGLTTDGMLFHSRVHNEQEREMRNGRLTIRGLRVSSRQLGISGICDAVEFSKADNGITINGYDGKWEVLPIEYKRSQKDIVDADAAQLCAEAMCLEEMLCCNIPIGFLYFGAAHRRQKVTLDAQLREKVHDTIAEMHQYYSRGYTPKVRPKKGCGKCSLKDICLPNITKVRSVRRYIDEKVGDMD
jgi:CRISPR-associated exonuclease Cas4